MKYFVLVALLIFLLVMVQFSQAQTIDDVITKYETARGGKEKLNTIKSIYMEGIRKMMDNEIPVHVTIEQDKLSRTEFEMGGGIGFLLVTDKAGWSFFPFGNKEVNKFSVDAVANMQTELDIEGPLTDYVAKGHKTELVGKDTLNGVECYKIKLTSKAGKEILYWIDAENNLLVQSSQKAVASAGPGGDNEIKTIYRDYKEVDGVKFAHTIETTGGFAGVTVFDKIELNKPVDPKMYKPE